MYQTIGEKIEVVSLYSTRQTKTGFKLTPLKFRWQTKVYPIQEITLVTDSKDGGIRKRFYSVMSRGNVYRLSFNRENETWILEEVWMEG